MMESFSDWLANTTLSAALRDVSWIVPLSQTIHILAIAIVLSSVGMLELRLLGVTGRRVSLTVMAQRFVPWIWGALVVLAFTGSLLIVAEPSRSLLNPAFQTKMCLLACAIAMTLIVQRSLREEPGFWNSSRGHQRAAQATGVISIVLWLGIVICGRLIAYVGSST